MTRRDKDMMEWIQNPSKKTREMSVGIKISFGVVIIFLCAVMVLEVKNMRSDKEIINILLSHEQAEAMPLFDGGRNTDTGSSMTANGLYVMDTTGRMGHMDPVEIDGELFSGHAVVSFNTSDGPVAKYDGNFKNGLFNGQGTLTGYYEDGKTIKNVGEGTWKDGNLDGQGTHTIYYEDGKTVLVVYEGTFKDSKPNGQGAQTWYYEDGKTIKGVGEGTWKDGGLDGQGTETIYNEDGKTVHGVYRGTYKDCKRDGLGTVTIYNKDGKTVQDVYEGTFKDNNYNGQGTYTNLMRALLSTTKDEK